MATRAPTSLHHEAQDLLPRKVRRVVLISLFCLLIVAALIGGYSALAQLNSSRVHLSGPESPVPVILERIDESLRGLIREEHQANGRTQLLSPARLQPLLEEFQKARRHWSMFSEADLAVDVLLSRRLTRQIEAFEQRFVELLAMPQSNQRDYDRLQLDAVELQRTVAETLRQQLSEARKEHAREMSDIRTSTYRFVLFATLALASFLILGGLYLRQMRRYDRHIEALHELGEKLSSGAGQTLFEGLVGFLGRQLGTDYVFIGQLNPDDSDQIDTLAVYAHGKLAGNISYRLPGTPCQNVMSTGICFYPSGVQVKFPDDRLLVEMGVDSYAGTPLLDSQGEPLGILVLLDGQGIDPKTVSSTLIKIAAARAQNELERLRSEASRARLTDELEARVDARTIDLRRTNEKLSDEVRVRREIEQELQRARETAERANRAKGEFLANASHEIRTHINGLLGMLSLLEDSSVKGEQLEYVEMAHMSGDVLLALINDLLDYSKIEAGQLELERIDFDTHGLVNEVVELFAMRARTLGLELAVEIDPETPAWLNGDAVRIRQVLSNLVDNALKFTPEGRITIRIGCEASEEEPVRLCIEVEDTGIGIDPERRALLFEPFVQADSSITRRFGGTGLGLAICAQLIHLLGGTIDVEAHAGGGTRFWFSVPLHRPQRVLREDENGAMRDSLDGLRILVVDDSAVSRAYLRSLLVAWHIDCSTAADGTQALQMILEAATGTTPYDVVLLDRMMPEMDGLELARQIKEACAGSAPKLVMVTRYGGGVGGDEALRAGISGYLNKPVSQSQLYDTLVAVTGIQSRVKRVASPNARLPTGRILVVEDNPVNQKVALGLLRKLDYQADLAAHGREALEAIQRSRYDLVLMDCQMPVMDGYEAVLELRRLEGDGGEHLPVIAMTAHALGGEREKCLAVGMDDYLAKPVRITDLKQKIDYWCSRQAPDASPDIPAKPAGDAVPTARPATAAAPPMDDGNNEASLDESILTSLQEVMGSELQSLLEAYVQDSISRLDELREVVSRDRSAVARLAHTLKGSSANVGAARLAALCARLHAQAQGSGPAQALTRHIDALDTEFARVRVALREYVPELG